MRKDMSSVMAARLRDVMRAFGIVVVVHDSNVDSRYVTNWTMHG
jgi:hypothetical protein